jgi:hypothetical protein
MTQLKCKPSFVFNLINKFEKQKRKFESLLKFYLVDMEVQGNISASE